MSKKVREYALFVLVCVALIAAREWLPYDGVGLVVRWVIGAVLGIGLVLWLAALLISSVREFRRGLAGEKGPARD